MNSSKISAKGIGRQDFVEAYGQQKDFFNTGQTKRYQFRKNALLQFKSAINQFENELVEAMHKDSGKPEFEARVGDVGLVYQEINIALSNLRQWMQPTRVPAILPLFFSKNRIYRDPFGVVLIISPWNYPVLLSLVPVVSAIAAGNCVFLKPSEFTPHTSGVLEKLLRSVFDARHVRVVQGEGSEVVPMMMESVRFDQVFFTGSYAVGRSIAKMAAEKIVPTIMELGGKSPAIVDETADLDITAKRIAFGKFFNAGQTCVAPDYVLIPKDRLTSFVDRLRYWIEKFHGKNPKESPDFGRIISQKRFNVLVSYLSQGEILIGGKYDENELFIEPTVIGNVTWTDTLMQDEIFGPILPILPYDNWDQVKNIISKNPEPLSLYLFTKDKKLQRKTIDELSFGGGIVNHCLLHFPNSELPFGGVGNSGYGRYHGKSGFNAFTHEKSVMTFGFVLDNPLVFPPYGYWKQKLHLWYLKHFT